MDSKCKLRLSFEPDFRNVDMVRAAVKGVCTDHFQLHCDAASVMDFSLIVTELVNNAVEHSGSEMITAEIFVTDHEAVFLLVTEGTRFDPTAAATMPQPEQLSEGGYGLALIHELADGMEYEYRENRNRVTLRKAFPMKNEEE